MIEAEARPRRLDKREVTVTGLGRRTGQCTGAISSRRQSEMAAERPCEDLMALEPDCESDVEHRLIARGEPGRRPLELETQRILFRRLAHHLSEGSMKMERRPSRPRGELLKRGARSASIANLANDLQEISGRGHGLAQS